MLHEAVVLLGGAFGQRLKPVGVMGNAKFHSPAFHTICNRIGDGEVEMCAVVNYVAHLCIHLGRKILEHLLSVEHIFPEIIRRALFGNAHFHRTLLEGVVNHLKP